jgi:hypothetical protein
MAQSMVSRTIGDLEVVGVGEESPTKSDWDAKRLA